MVLIFVPILLSVVITLGMGAVLVMAGALSAPVITARGAWLKPANLELVSAYDLDTAWTCPVVEACTSGLRGRIGNVCAELRGARLFMHTGYFVSLPECSGYLLKSPWIFSA